MLIGVLPCGACGFILTESLTPHQSFSPSLGDLYREELYQISFGVMSAQRKAWHIEQASGVNNSTA